MIAVLTVLIDARVDYLLIGFVTAAVLVPLAWVIIKAGRIKAPVYRYMIWFYSLIAIVVLPAICLCAPKINLEILPACDERVEPARVPKGHLSDAMIPAVEPSARNYPVEPSGEAQPHVDGLPADMPGTTEMKARAFPIELVFVAAWCAGFALMLTRLGVGWYRLRRICLTATVLPMSKYRLKAEGRNLRVLLTTQLCGPVCFGVFRPVIILP